MGKKKSKNPGLKVLPKGGRGTQRLVIMEQWEERLYSSLLLTFGFNTFLLKNRAVVVRKDLGQINLGSEIGNNIAHLWSSHLPGNLYHLGHGRIWQGSNKKMMKMLKNLFTRMLDLQILTAGFPWMQFKAIENMSKGRRGDP